MIFNDDISTAEDFSSAAIRLMKEREQPATPQNYALWYAYASGKDSELNKALDEALSGQETIAGSVVSEIHERFLGDEQHSSVVLEAGDSLSSVVENLLNSVSQANDEAAVFSTALAQGAGSLDGLTDPTAIGGVVKVLAESAQNMVAQNAALQKSLEESSQEVATLKENLVSVQKEAMTDGLTGISNRKCFDMTLSQEMRQAAATSAPLCLILADIDHFKQFNDTHGHQTGDHVLRFVAMMLKGAIKTQDMAARYGGEEFAIILPNTDLNSAMAIAETVRTAVAAKHLRKKQTGMVIGNIALSLGVARYRAGESIAELIKRADDGLYMAKRTGRNKSVVETELDAVAD